MDRVYQANAIETPPTATSSSGSYPTAGNKASGQLATVPGPYWFYSVTEEIRNALIKAGLIPDASKVNQLAEALGKFLPLAGGAMTGNIAVGANFNITPTVSNSRVVIYGGNGVDNGAYIAIGGKDSTSYKGGVQLRAKGESTSVTVELLPDGSFKKGGNEIITSAGGAMTGGITFTGSDGFLKKNATNGRMIIYGGTTNNDGSSLYLYGKGHGTYPAWFGLVCNDGTNSSTLQGRPNGILTWGGKDVVCVESWKSGYQWYRKYSDGWIDQGGRLTCSTNQTKTITLPMAFSNTNYNVSFAIEKHSSTDVGHTDDTTLLIDGITTSSLGAFMYDTGDNSYSTSVRWRACGY